MEIKRCENLLKTKEEIKAFLEISSDQAFYQYVKAGLPVCVFLGAWIGHKIEIEDFLRKSTRGGQRDLKVNGK